MVCAQLIGEHEEADDSESERSSGGGVVLFTQESSEGEEARPRRTEKERVFFVFCSFCRLVSKSSHQFSEKKTVTT